MALSVVRPSELSSPEELQLQEVVPRGVQIKTETEENSDDYLGIVGVLDDPFNLYLRVDELVSGARYIRFFVYSSGRKSILLWGYYDRRAQSFQLDGYCRPMLSQMGDLIRQWAGWDFQISTYAVAARSFTDTENLEQRIQENKAALTEAYKGLKELHEQRRGPSGGPPKEKLTQIAQFILETQKEIINLQEQLTVRRITPEEYRRMKYFVAYQDRKIDPEEIDQALGEGAFDELYNTFEDASMLDVLDRDNPELYHPTLQKYTQRSRRLIEKYEEWRNIHENDRDLIRRLDPAMVAEFRKITERFYRWIATGRFSRESFINGAPRCPKRAECEGGHTEDNPACELYSYGETPDYT